MIASDIVTSACLTSLDQAQEGGGEGSPVVGKVSDDAK